MAHGVMEKMMELAAIKNGDKVYDLGCGDARLLIEANKKYGAQAVGIDLSPLALFLARISRRFARADVTLVRGNIYKYDFSDADVIFCYLMPRPMEKLKKQFVHLKKGSRIISHRFEIPGWTPVVHIQRDDRRGIPSIYKYEV